MEASKPPAAVEEMRSGAADRDGDGAALSRFASLDDNALNHIFSFLPWKDLNEVACVSKQCSQIRRHDDLDQTREATIKFLPPSSKAHGKKMPRFQIPASHNQLVFVNFQNVKRPTSILAPRQEHVTHVTIQGQGTAGHSCSCSTFLDLVNQLKNVEEAHLINLEFGDNIARHWPSSQWPKLSCLDCRNTTLGGIMDPWFLGLKGLKELNLDGATITVGSRGVGSCGLFHGIRNTLERLSCVNFELVRETHTGTMVNCYGKREALWHFVIEASKLRWFRSDLEESDIACLRFFNRPDVTFVSPHDTIISAGSTFDAGRFLVA